MTDNLKCNLEQIESIVGSMNDLEKSLLFYAKNKKWITHCFDCEESHSSRGLAPYIHTCRCYCGICS